MLAIFCHIVIIASCTTSFASSSLPSILNATEKARGVEASTTFLKLFRFPLLHSSISLISIKVKMFSDYKTSNYKQGKKHPVFLY